MAEEQKTALGFGKKLSSELTDALPYSISAKSKTYSTSRHLDDITFAFQYFCVPTRLEYLMVLCFDLILISMNWQTPRHLEHNKCSKWCLFHSIFFFSFPSNYAWLMHLSPWKAKCLSDCLLYCLSHFFDFPAVEKRVQSGVKIY